MEKALVYLLVSPLILCCCNGSEPSENKSGDHLKDHNNKDSLILNTDTLETDEFGYRTRVKGDTIFTTTRLGCLMTFIPTSESKYMNPTFQVVESNLKKDPYAPSFEPQDWYDSEEVQGTIIKEYIGTFQINDEYHVFLVTGGYEEGGYEIIDTWENSHSNAQFPGLPVESPDGSFIFQNWDGYNGVSLGILFLSEDPRSQYFSRYITDIGETWELSMLELKTDGKSLLIKTGYEHFLEDTIRDEEQCNYYAIEYSLNYQTRNYRNAKNNELLPLASIRDKWFIQNDIAFNYLYNTIPNSKYKFGHFFDEVVLDTICPDSFHVGTKADFSKIFYEYNIYSKFNVDFPKPLDVKTLDKRGFRFEPRGYLWRGDSPADTLKSLIVEGKNELIRYWYKKDNGFYNVLEIDSEGNFRTLQPKGNEGYCVKCFLDQP